MKLRNAGRVWPVLALGLVVASCSEGGAAREAGATKITPASAEARVRAAYVAARQESAATEPAYALRRGDDGAYVSGPSATEIQSRFDARGATLSRAGQSWRATFAGSRAGCAGERVAIATDADAVPHFGESANRVDYARHAGRVAIDEWYVHGPLGLEQGFTVAESPCASDGDLRIEVAVDGLAPFIDAAGVSLRDGGGTTRLNYTDLAAHDSDGHELDAAMTVEGGAIVLHVVTRGARFPVVVDPLAWFQIDELTPADGAAGYRFGVPAIDGDTAIIGAWGATVGSNSGQGAAYVFTRSGGNWVQQQKLVASDGVASAVFGSAVALSGSTAVIGAPGDPYGSPPTAGAAYVFTAAGGAWTQQQKLTASDNATGNVFGSSVALSGSTLVVGAPGPQSGLGVTLLAGSAYVYALSNNGWAPQTKLVASDGADEDLFGGAVAMSGNVLVVGADNHTVGANAQQGAAYVFTQAAATWTQTQELVSSDGAAEDLFGGSVAASGDTIAIGTANKTAAAAGAGRGVAYVFTQTSGTWSQSAELPAPSGASGFGESIALAGQTLVVDADETNVGATLDQGAVFVYAGTGGTWAEQAELIASDGADYDGDNDGYAVVAISGTTILVGTPHKSVGPTDLQGVTYVFSYGLTNGDPCSAASACASGSCVDGVCCDTACTSLCQACTAALKQSGVDGTCGPAKVGTNPHHDDCGPDAVATCARDGQCDGKGTCQDFAAGTACGTTCAEGVYSSSTCGGGSGTCVAGPSVTCPIGYGCTGASCNPTCSANTDCTSGYACTSGQCVHTGATCADDHTAVDAMGHTTDCAPFECAAGACLKSCTSVNECVEPNVCDTGGACVAAPAKSTGDSSGGCSVRGAADTGASPWAIASALALAALAGARRRKRSP